MSDEERVLGNEDKSEQKGTQTDHHKHITSADRILSANLRFIKIYYLLSSACAQLPPESPILLPDI